MSGAAKQGEDKVRRNKEQRPKRETQMQGTRERGESQGESHLFASEKLLKSMGDLRERALKSPPKMP